MIKDPKAPTLILQGTPLAEFCWADYTLAPAYQWHVRQQDTPLLPEQILLHSPLHSDPFGKVMTASKARSGQRGCLWWAEWGPTGLPSVYHAFQTGAERTNLLVFQQLRKGYTEPFRLMMMPAENLPKPSTKYWPLVYELLMQLPAIPISIR
ncbi:hypothetical protein [Spirosoma areae]